MAKTDYLKNEILTLKFKNAKKIFPNKITRITCRDFLTTRFNKDKFLSNKEKEKLEFFASPEGKLIHHSDLLLKRIGNYIKIIPFD